MKNNNLSIKRLLLAVVVLGSLFFTDFNRVLATVGVNRQINFQGKIVNKTSGTNVIDGNYDFVFKLYNSATGGTAVWTESRTGSNQVAIKDGVFQVALGAVTTFASANADFSNSSLYLGVTFSTDEEMTTRVRLMSSPYALFSESVQGLTIPTGNTVTFAGNFNTTINSTANTDITLPISGVLSTLAGIETLSNKTIGSTGLVFANAATDITTISNQNLAIIPNGTGMVGIGTDSPTTILDVNGALTVQPGIINSKVADSSSATGFTLNTTNALSTVGAKLLSLQTAGLEKFYIDKDGNLYTAGTITAGNGTGILMTNKSGATVSKRSLVVLDPTNNSSFITTTTPYSKSAYGVVTGVGMLVGNDADNDGVCDANDVCMVTTGGEVEVLLTNAASSGKGDYIFTGATAGSGVSSTKQFDGLVGVVSSIASAGSGYVKMIFKVQPTTSTALAIDKTSKYNDFQLLANEYKAANVGSDTQTNLPTKGVFFDTFVDSTKVGSADTTVSVDNNNKKVGLVGGQTMSTATTDNAGNTYLGSNTVNKVFYYDRNKIDSAPQVQVELGIDPNWYNGVTLSVATSSAQYSQNSTITPKNPNLSTSYNGSLVKVTGTYASSAKTIYITIKNANTFDWTDYNGNAGTSVAMTHGIAQALGTTGVSTTFTAANYNVGDVFKIASWFVEPVSSTRGTKQQFPERSNIIAGGVSGGVGYIDIIDADTQKLWMRFFGATGNIFISPTITAQSTQTLNGKLYIATNTGAGDGRLIMIDFGTEKAINSSSTFVDLYKGSISQRNAGMDVNRSTSPSHYPFIVNNSANDVSAAVIPNQPTQTVTVSGWGYIQGTGATYVTETVNLPYKFNNIPVVNSQIAGYKGTTPPANLSECSTQQSGERSNNPTITSSSFVFREDSSGALSSGNYWCYTWTATGQVSPKQFVAVATGGGNTFINETDQTSVNLTTAAGYHMEKIKLLDNGNWYTTVVKDNFTEYYLNTGYYLPNTSGDIATMRNYYYTNSTIPAVIPLLTTTINSLEVTKGASTVDGKSNSIYVGTATGLAVIQEKQSGATAGDGSDEKNGSVKYYTKDYISEEMVGDIRGMYPFNGTTGSSIANGAAITDISVKANGTIAKNANGTGMAYATGVRGTAINFDGTDDYVCSGSGTTCAANTNFDFGTGGFTISAWIKTSTTGVLQYIVNDYGYALDSRTDMYRFYVNNTNKVGFSVRDSASGQNDAADGNTVVTDGRWHHVVATRASVLLSVYVDGRLDGSYTSASAGRVSPSYKLSIGAMYDASNVLVNFFNGQIDEPFVTATALTAGQIKNMYQVGYRALQSHSASGLGSSGADTNQQLGYISTGTSVIGDARPDWNNQYMYVGTNSTTLGAVSKIQLNSDTNV
ncbi:MAG: LamG domain-containing protein, partial [bacterium]